MNKSRAASLVRTVAATGLPLVFGLGGVSGICGLVGCQDQATIGAAETDKEGALVGEIESFVVDREDGTSDREQYLSLSDPAHTRLRLVFDEGMAPTGSANIRAWGTRRGDVLRVSSFEAVADTSSVSIAEAALIGATPKPRKAVFVLVDVGGGVNTDMTKANTTVFSPGNNFANVYNQLSYGILPFTGDVVGPLSYPMTTCDYSGLQKALKPMISGTYQHYMWYLGSNVGACAWSGIGAEGNASRPQSDSWYNASTGCTVLVQEVGHNLGWMHSSTLRCTGASFLDNPSTCTSSEYGNRYTPMGSGCGHFVGYDKWYNGLIGGCNGVKVTTSATFNLMPLENACNGIQAIQIPMLNTTRTATPQQGSAQPLKNYFIEYRGPWGLDTSSVKTPQVMVYATDDVKVNTKTSNWTWLLDMTPATTTFDGLAAGASFMDPAGNITIKVVSADTTKAVVQIDITGGAGAAPTCIDGTSLTAPGPEECGMGASMGGSTGSTGGASGTGGAVGVGGATGTGGRGTGGATGTGGTVGTGGAASGTGGRPTGTGGAGTGGAVVVGTGGTVAGSGGSAVTGGTATNPGTGGATTGSGGQTVVGEAGSVTGGCACSTSGDAAGRSWSGGLALLGLGLVAGRRGRNRRQ